MIVALVVLLVWVFLSYVLYAWVAKASDEIPGTRSAMKKMLSVRSCPTCGERFTPDKCSWETSTKCLNGLDYCAPCKVKGLCGC